MAQWNALDVPDTEYLLRHISKADNCWTKVLGGPSFQEFTSEAFLPSTTEKQKPIVSISVDRVQSQPSQEESQNAFERACTNMINPPVGTCFLPVSGVLLIGSPRMRCVQEPVYPPTVRIANPDHAGIGDFKVTRDPQRLGLLDKPRQKWIRDRLKEKARLAYTDSSRPEDRIRVEFSIHYVTTWGEQLHISFGNRRNRCAFLTAPGDWSPQSEEVMTWTAGHYWKLSTTLQRKQIYKLEYRYCVKTNGTLSRWDDCSYRVLSPHHRVTNGYNVQDDWTPR